jgi:hypothetical protein
MAGILFEPSAGPGVTFMVPELIVTPSDRFSGENKLLNRYL